jgi:hypothetical protein
VQTGLYSAIGWSIKFSINLASLKIRSLVLLYRWLRVHCCIRYADRFKCSLGGVAALAATRNIHRCFERVNQLLSLLVPVSDINRAAAGKVAVHRTVACAKTPLAGKKFPNLPNPNRASGEV